MAGTSGKTLSQKLGIKPGFCIFAAGPPVKYQHLVRDLPAQVRIVTRLGAGIDMVHLFATGAAELRNRLPACRDAIKPDGMIWVSWPKKSSRMVTDLSDVVVRDNALGFGLVDVKVCAIDQTWSGLKFVIRKELRASPQARSPGGTKSA
jgi:hypothetical protein